MSDDRGPARLAKWPFYLADVLLCAVIFFVLNRLGTFEGTSEMVIVALCLLVAAIAAWISVVPWLKEHEAAVHLTDSSNLKSSLEQIKSVDKVADLIRQSNAQWQGVQEASARTVNSAREITDRMKVEADEFMKFISNAHDQERAGLRLEVEKLRRMEGDWIKTSVQMLDHVFALTRAAERSGQAQLIKQLHQFQNACRDVARRMGLAAFVPAPGEPFDSRAHQLTNPQMTAGAEDRIHDVLACGFTYQGQLLRRSLVVLEGAQEGSQPMDEALEHGAGESRVAAQSAPVEEPSPVDQQASNEPPAIIDSTQLRQVAGSALETEHFEEVPAVVDSYEEQQGDIAQIERGQSESTRRDDESLGDSAQEAPAARSPRSKKKTSQEELPF